MFSETNDSKRKTQIERENTFLLKDCALIAIATGKRALTLKELRDNLRTIASDSIYHHFWGSLLEPRFEQSEYNNDFAAWGRRGLHDGTLAERLAMVDPTDYPDLQDLRQELLDVIEERLDESDRLQWLPATEAFEFIRSQIVVFDTYKQLKRPEELAQLLPHLSVSSIFYHFIDARRRLPEGQNDFQIWVSSFNEAYQDLAKQLAAIDPYFVTLTELRQQLTILFNRYCTGVK